MTAFRRPLVTALVVDDAEPYDELEVDFLGPPGFLPLPYIHALERDYGPRWVDVLSCRIVEVH